MVLKLSRLQLGRNATTVPKKDVVPAGPKDPTNLPSESPDSPTFPHYPTMKLQLDDAQSNLLANMMGWVVLKNQDLFCRGLGVIGGCPNQ